MQTTARSSRGEHDRRKHDRGEQEHSLVNKEVLKKSLSEERLPNMLMAKGFLAEWENEKKSDENPCAVRVKDKLHTLLKHNQYRVLLPQDEFFKMSSLCFSCVMKRSWKKTKSEEDLFSIWLSFPSSCCYFLLEDLESDTLKHPHSSKCCKNKEIEAHSFMEQLHFTTTLYNC